MGYVRRRDLVVDALLESLEPRIVLDGEWSAMEGASVDGSISGNYLTVTTLNIENEPLVFEQVDRLGGDDDQNDLWSLLGLVTTDDGASDAPTFDALARRSIALHGDRLLVGAPAAEGGAGAVAAFRYNDDSGAWRLDALLTAPDAQPGDGFGWAIDIHGNTAVIGSFAGERAWVFRDQGSWDLQETLAASIDQQGFFGRAVATDGSIIAIGAPGEETTDDDDSATSGAVYIFERDDGWELEERIAAPDNARDSEFGHSVAVRSNTVIVGAWLDDDRGEASGSVFALGRDSGDWVIEAKITPNGDATGARYGAAVAASGSRAAVISLGGDDAESVAQILKRRGDRWSVEATLDADGDEPAAWRSVDFHGDRVILGGDGEAVVFRKSEPDDTWSQETTLTPQSDVETARVGFDVAAHGETFVVAGMLAPGLDDGDNPVDVEAAAWTYRAPDDDDNGDDDFGDDDDDDQIRRRVWVARTLGDIPGVDDPVSDVLTWTDRKDGLTYAAVATTDGLVLLTRSADRSTWTARNLTIENQGSEEIVGDISVFGTRGNRVYIVGYAADGDMVIYRQNGLGSAGEYDWVFENLTEEELRPRGLETPRFAGTLTTFVTRWNAINIAGLDDNGDVRAVWTTPGLEGWRSSNLSAVAGTPRLAGELSVFLTPWGAMNLAGTDDDGDLTVTWWTPQTDQWIVSDFNALFNGPELTRSTVTAFVTPWGGLNIAGRDSRGDLVVYWWTPQLAEGGDDSWRVTNLSAEITGADQPEGPMRGLVTPDGEINLFGTNSIQDVIRYFWRPDTGWQSENLTHTAESF